MSRSQFVIIQIFFFLALLGQNSTPVPEIAPAASVVSCSPVQEARPEYVWEKFEQVEHDDAEFIGMNDRYICKQTSVYGNTGENLSNPIRILSPGTKVTVSDVEGISDPWGMIGRAEWIRLADVCDP